MNATPPNTTPDDRPFGVLTVCLGNICRSPLTAQLLRLQLDPARFTVASAGLGAVVGAAMDSTPAEISMRLGGDPEHEARQLTGHLVDAADVVLTMERAQRDQTIQRYPQAMFKTFTLAEFAALLDDAPDQLSLHAAPRALAARRHTVRLAPHDDVPDPYRRSREVHEGSATQIAALVERVAAGLSGLA